MHHTNTLSIHLFLLPQSLAVNCLACHLQESVSYLVFIQNATSSILTHLTGVIHECCHDNSITHYYHNNQCLVITCNQ